MAIEGTLGDFRLGEILQAVAQQRRTGILTLQSETTIVAVSFLAGGVVSADSLAHTVEDRLGEGLVAEGLVDPATIADLTRRQDAGEARLIELLVAEGVLSREGVLDALRRQNLALLRELLGWSAGEFKFYGGDEVAYEEGIDPISIDGLLLSTLDAEEGGGLASPAPSAATAGQEAETGATAESVPAGADDAWTPPAPAAAQVVAPGPAGTANRGAQPAELAVPAPRRERPSARPAAATEAPVVLDPAPRAAPPALGLLLAAAVVVAALASPRLLVVPFPWQSDDRRALAEVQRLADRLAVDRAAKTYFLLEGHFPPSFGPLVASGLLDGGDRVGPEGRRLTLVAHEESYDVLADGAEQPVWSEAISGNFLLDPELRGSAAAPAREERPLVLLD